MADFVKIQMVIICGVLIFALGLGIVLSPSFYKAGTASESKYNLE